MYIEPFQEGGRWHFEIVEYQRQGGSAGRKLLYSSNQRPVEIPEHAKGYSSWEEAVRAGESHKQVLRSRYSEAQLSQTDLITPN